MLLSTFVNFCILISCQHTRKNRVTSINIKCDFRRFQNKLSFIHEKFLNNVIKLILILLFFQTFSSIFKSIVKLIQSNIPFFFQIYKLENHSILYFSQPDFKKLQKFRKTIHTHFILPITKIFKQPFHRNISFFILLNNLFEIRINLLSFDIRIAFFVHLLYFLIKRSKF